MVVENNCSDISCDSDFYLPLMENNLIKVSSLVFAVALSVVNQFLASGIIWFEKYGSNGKPTLINQLVALGCWLVPSYLLFIEMPGNKNCHVIGLGHKVQ